MQPVTATTGRRDASFLSHRKPDISATACTRGPGSAGGTRLNAAREKTAREIAHRRNVAQLVRAIVVDIKEDTLFLRGGGNMHIVICFAHVIIIKIFYVCIA